MATSGFKSTLSITHIGTATAILDIDGVKFLTDPFFSPAGTIWDLGPGLVLKNTDDPALKLEELPPIDAVLLSHEDHPDNLDDFGRQALNGRHVLTTMDGAKNLAPRPGVVGLKPWESISKNFGGKDFEITATPCQHMPGGECIGFIIRTESFGINESGLPNVVYFSGDTIYFEELAEISKKYHVACAILNIGAATVPLPTGPLLVTMDGKQAARLQRDLNADWIVPMHYESWGHFTQGGEGLAQDFQSEGVHGRVKWLTPGKPVTIL